MTEIVEQWMEKAKRDLRSARHLLTLKNDCPYDVIAFHAQQAVEKYVKALLIHFEIEFSKSHDIGELVSLLPSSVSFPLSVPEQATLTDYAVTGRYPGEWEPLTAERALESIEWAEKVSSMVDSVVKK